MSGLAVGIDIGGTKLAAGLVAGDGSVLGRTRADTPAGDPDAIVDTCVEVTARLLRDVELPHPPVGVGAAGMIDLDGVVRYAPNIAWTDFPLQARLGEAVGAPVTVHNDANVAAWAEFRCGAARDAPRSMVMLTIGTGLGGGLVQEGRLVRGAHGFGAEFGHVVVREGGRRCPCGNLGCLEAYASGTAIGLIAAERLAAGDVPDDSALRATGEPSGKAVTLAAHAGDPAAIDVVEEAGRWLGVGVASLVNALDPEIVVLGGGAMEAGELLLRPARETMASRVMGRRHRALPPVVRSALADDAGFVGAGLLALDGTGRG